MTGDARPTFGAGIEQLELAALYQHFYDAKHGDSDTRNEALKWLKLRGREVWVDLGLPEELFTPAYLLWVPEHLVDDSVIDHKPEELS